MNNRPKYYVIGGRVRDRYGDWHYMHPDCLIWLYNVDPRECYCIRDMRDARGIDLAAAEREGSKILRPRSNGNYEISA